MSDLHALARAISTAAQKISATANPNIRAFADADAAYALAVADILQPVTPPDPPIFTQGYTQAELQLLRTAGDLATPHDYSLTAADPTRARFEVRPGDQWSTWSGERSQIQRPDIQGKEGDAWHWSFTFTLDPSWLSAPADHYTVLWEHHHTGSTGSPPSTLQVKGARLVWTQIRSNDPAKSNDWSAYDLGPIRPGIATAIDVRCTLSADPAKAATRITSDYLTTITGPNLLAGMNVYPMWGLYRAPSPLTQVVTFGPVSRYA